MRSLSVIRHPDFRKHATPESHPETPQRLAVIDKALDASDIAGKFADLAPRAATENEIASVHSATYIEQLAKQAKIAQEQHALIELDPSTYIGAASYDIAKLAAGAGLKAVESVTKDNFFSSFVAVRPPGHHALVRGQMGFCLFNNVALAARFARDHLGYQRIMIIDWDVHHGNGTQEIFYKDPTVCFISLHQYPLWPPNSGWFTEDGAGDGCGFNINIPLPPGTGDSGYFNAWINIVTPICLEFEPQLILLSAGYDAHKGDPLAEQEVSTWGFARLSARLVDLASITKAKVVCFLEGGYNLETLGESAVATMRVLSADNLDRQEAVISSYVLPGRSKDASKLVESSDLERERIRQVRQHFANYWKSLR